MMQKKYSEYTKKYKYLQFTLNGLKIAIFPKDVHVGFQISGIDGEFHILFAIASSDSNTSRGIIFQMSKEVAMFLSSNSGFWWSIMPFQD